MAPSKSPPVLVLKTARLTLRELEPGDGGFIVGLLNDPDFLRYIGDRGVRDLETARSYIAKGPAAMYERLGFGLWRAEITADGTPIGLCGLLKRDTLPDVDLGYALLSQFRGQGYAREAAAATLHYGRAVLGLRRIVAIVSPDNDASIRLLTGLGMRDEGLITLPGSDGQVSLYGIG